jgi:hypothetical protein
MKRNHPFRCLLRWFLRLLLLCIVLLLLDYVLYPGFAAVGGKSANIGENGIWLRYRWYFGKYDETQFNTMAGHLRDSQIRYAYCHVRDIRPDGSLRFHYPREARKLIGALHKSIPKIKVYAWIYVANEHAPSAVDIAKPAIRKRMIDEAVWLVKECGFDAIQWDYEICADGDPRLITLLQETRAALPKGTPISVCTAMWYPPGTPGLYGWSPAYFTKVAALCDQITVMCYDSGIWWPRGYVWLVKQQARCIPAAVAKGNPHCRVLLGMPTYEKGGPSHHARAENLRLALKGVREGLAAAHPYPANFAGVSLFADYTTSEAEWQIYEKFWRYQPQQ